MKSKLIALDIDGTILDRNVGFPVPSALKDAVYEARRAGARVCFCTSRPCFMMEDASRIGEIDAIIGNGGASIEIISVPDNIKLYTDALPLPLLLSCFEAAKGFNIYISFVGEEKIYVRRKGNVDPSVAGDPLFIIMDEDLLLEKLMRGAELFSSVFIFTEPGMPDEAVINKPGLEDATVCKSNDNCFIITNKGTDKGTGVLRLAEYWDIPREAILAIGNDDNDIPMLKAAGVGVAVANASPGTLAAADWIAPSVERAGAAEAIRRFAME